MSLLQSLQIGKRGMAVQSAAINTAGHNIANVSTPGYARQRAVISSLAAREQSIGAEVVDIEHIRDQLIERHLREETQALAHWQTSSQWLGRLEGLVMRDGETPLNSAMGHFWNSWQDLANTPDSMGVRQTVIERAEMVTSEIHALRQQLQDMAGQINQQMHISIREVNTSLTSIAELNRSIVVAEASGRSANDLRDQRDQLVLELSHKINVQAIEDEFGNDTLTMAGMELVHQNEAVSLTLDESVRDGLPVATPMLENGEQAPIKSGELKGLMEVRDEAIPDLIGRLDRMTEAFIEQVNGLHRDGYGSEYQTGLDFFSGHDSQSIQVAVTAPQIAASGDPGSATDNAVALHIAQLRVHGTVGETGQSFESFFTDTVIEIGLATQQAGQYEANQTRLVASVREQQQSASGVSLDEEMVSLIQFQRAYQASARFLATVDELMQSVIGMAS